MNEKIKILDHGYIQLIESWGSDERIIEAARMSTDKGFNGWGLQHAKECELSIYPNGLYTLCNCKPKQGDEKLLKYLYEHKHMTPFEMAGLLVEVQAPIFVFREWHRHRTQSYNEMSARYTPLPDVNYIPSVERLMISGGANKQASGTGVNLSKEEACAFIQNMIFMYDQQELLYQHALRVGVPKELARIGLGVGRYSKMRASANLRNWLAFLTLRMDENAQWEIRQYANGVGQIVESLFPRTWELFSKR